MRKTYIQVLVYGAIIFIGGHNQIQIKSLVNNIQVILRNSLRDYIFAIIREERNSSHQIYADKLVRYLERFEMTRQFKPEAFTNEQLKTIRPGICCQHCRNFNLVKQGQDLTCACGFWEPLEEAIVRTICEYGALIWDRPFTCSEWMRFLKKPPSENYLNRILVRHFDVFKKGKPTYYVNNMALYEKKLSPI